MVRRLCRSKQQGDDGMNQIELVLKRVLNAPRGAVHGAAHEAGQTLAEYSLILTLVAVGVVAISVVFFTTALAGAYDSVTACLGGSC